MPTYDYQCKSCGHTWEVMQKVSAPPPSTCPSCESSSNIEKLFSANTKFVLKGDGFYKEGIS